MENEAIGEFVDINSLIPHPDNPRINNHAVEEVAGSIKRFGFASPIIARLEDRMIIAGHTRFKAAQSLGLDRVPVRFMDLDPVDAKLLMLADNKIGERADWDEEALQELFEELKDEDLSGLGWDDNELSGILGDLYSDQDDQEHIEPLPPIKSDFKFTLLKGNCLEKLKEIPDNSIDSVVTDPPYEIGFMGKGWDDSGIAFSVQLWKECLRVLKPGGHMVAFSATRTVHPMGVAIAHAGFEIRDMISWLYFSGFPKSHDVSKGIDKHLGAEREVLSKTDIRCGVFAHSGSGKPQNIEDYQKTITKPATPQAAQWEGWGTALKPSYEPAILARKPLEKGLSVAENVLKHGTGAINIDACRFAYGDPCWLGPQEEYSINKLENFSNFGQEKKPDYEQINHTSGRWPANIYQCPKASRSEREAGLEHLRKDKRGEYCLANHNGVERDHEPVSNFHPTVKPIGVMRWLCRLLTKRGGTVLDPFLGSGTTAVSACLEGFDAIGCEMTEDYYPIIEGRIEWAKRERENGPKE
tara:strand:- start:184 stop:1761 length:1578 start_codon:yes stop_codon:yes gene_type:complete